MNVSLSLSSVLSPSVSEAVPLVKKSVCDQAWIPRLRHAGQERMAHAIAQQCGVHEILARMLAGRGVTVEGATDFLHPTLKALLPDPSHLHDMDKAAQRLAHAIIHRETVAVFGDYDVDGATSTALLKQYFAALDRELMVYIPDRMKEGYGPNLAAFQLLHREGVSVLITVDCGTVAFEPIAWATDQGIDVMVIDHHMAEATLPEAYAVVNPNRLDQVSDCRHMAAVGVTFLLLVAVNRALRGQGWFADIPEPNLLQWLDLVALGTVCDVVSLTGINRALVSQGLKVMAQRRNVGIRALYDVAGLQESPNAYHAGFILGPRINAGGRVGEAALGSWLLATQDATEAQLIAQKLDGYNAERQAIEAGVLAAAMQAAARSDNHPVIVVAGERWHEGVIGIVAGRLKEHFNRPAVVISLHEGVGKASARSVPGADIGAAVTAARQEGLLLAGGGHAMAAGFSFTINKLEALQEYLCRILETAVSDYQLGRSLKIDGVIRASAANIELIDAIDQAAPFGMGNASAVLALMQQRIVHRDVLKGEHIKLITTDETGGRVNAMAFRAVGTPLGDLLMQAHTGGIHLAGSLKRNRWQGKETPQLIVEDAALA